MTKWFVLFVTVLMASANSNPVLASAVIVNQTLDLTQPKSFSGPGPQGWQGTPAFNGGFNVVISEGDTFEYTIDFSGSQYLSLTNTTSLWAYVISDLASDVEAEGTFSLLDSSGSEFLTSNLKLNTEGAVHLGQQFSDSDFAGGLPALITFYGVRYKGKVLDYLEPGVTSRKFYEPGFTFVADDAALGGASPVPEPGSIAVWALGAAGLAFVRRRRVR